MAAAIVNIPMLQDDVIIDVIHDVAKISFTVDDLKNPSVSDSLISI